MALDTNPWVKPMLWQDYFGAQRTLTHAYWLSLAVVADSWRLSLGALMAALRMNEGNVRVRVTAVSREWLREHEADRVKHGEAP